MPKAMTLQKMPHIPSSLELGYMGSMRKAGRNGDTEVAHVSPGEVIVPREVLEQYPDVAKIIGAAIAGVGADPNRYVVGTANNSINPYTGQPEFFLKRLFESPIGRIVFSIASSIVLPALAPSISAAAAGAIGSGVATKLGGGTWGQALGAGVGSYFGSSLMPGSTQFGPAGTIGAKLADNGLGSVANALPGALTSTNLASMAGSFLGSNFGESIGAMIDPPKIKAITGDAGTGTAATYNFGSGITPTAAIPQASSTTTASANDAANKGAGASASTLPAATYSTQVRDRNTGLMRSIQTPFSGAFDRQSSWGSGVVFV